jgi:hypothetical protein
VRLDPSDFAGMGLPDFGVIAPNHVRPNGIAGRSAFRARRGVFLRTARLQERIGAVRPDESLLRGATRFGRVTILTPKCRCPLTVDTHEENQAPLGQRTKPSGDRHRPGLLTVPGAPNPRLNISIVAQRHALWDTQQHPARSPVTATVRTKAAHPPAPNPSFGPEFWLSRNQGFRPFPQMRPEARDARSAVRRLSTR